MRHRTVTGVADSLPGIIFLAQSFDELLYEYSPASYKPRVMGLNGLCEEAVVLIEQIDSELIDRSRIESVLEEMSHVVHTDPVVKSLLDFDIEYYIRFPKDCLPSDLKVRIGLLTNKIANGAYVEALQNKLIEICGDGQKKKLIYQSARRWISALNSHGYSHQHIKQVVDSVFYAPAVKVELVSDLGFFFRSFSFDYADFDIVFAASSMISDVESVAKRFGASVIHEESTVFKSLAGKGLEVTDGERFFQIESVKALDAHAARAQAEKMLEHLSDLFVLFHHKQKIRWRSEVLVRRVDEEWGLVVPPKPSVKRARDNFPNKAAAKLDSAFSNLALTDDESVNRFISVVRLHGSALESVSSEAQLVNLWTAMEVLVHRESQSKLKAVIRLLTPFLIYGYVDRLIHALAGDLYRWKMKEFSKVLKIKSLKGWKLHHRLAVVLLGGDYEAKRDELYALASDYPLLCFRIFSISETISTRAKLDEVLKDHERRVIWQIRRIYRSRNLIVHDGSAPAYIDALTENAHEYLDAFIDRFLSLCARTKAATTLEEAVAFQAELYSQWRKVVVCDGNLSIENVKEICALEH